MDNVSSTVRDDEWVGTKLLFENEIVRVWDFHLHPGGSTKMHTHRRDWLYVNVTDNNSLRIDYPNQTEPAFQQMSDGDVSYRVLDEIAENKRTHQANNIGDGPVRQVLVEFKKRAKID